MSRPEICPTCGIKLGPTQPRPATRVCTACSRSNPAGFNYCGFCATPMENTEMGARMADLAAPPGGWPSLTSELVEVRFYLQQGLFDDAYELLSIMQKRYPGHPQLNELSRRPKPARRVDTGVLALVDSVLAESANLVAKVPRRAAPRFTAPAQGGSDRTDVHSVVPPDDEATTTAARPPKRAKTGPESTTRRSGAQPKVGTGSQRTTPQKPSGPSGSHRTSVGPRPTAAAAPKSAARADADLSHRRAAPGRAAGDRAIHCAIDSVAPGLGAAARRGADRGTPRALGASAGRAAARGHRADGGPAPAAERAHGRRRCAAVPGAVPRRARRGRAAGQASPRRVGREASPRAGGSARRRGAPGRDRREARAAAPRHLR